MRGHIAKKGKVYYAVIYEGINPATGRGRHRWHRAGNTRKEAERLLADLVKRSHDGDYRAPEKITLSDYLTERWLPTKQAQLRPSTSSSYRRNIEIHVVPHIGHILLERLTPEDLDAFYAMLLREGRRNGDRGGLAPKTVRYIHSIIRKALADASRKGTVVRNVADLADPPKLAASPRRQMTVWTADQLRTFLEHIEGHHLYPAFYLAANTGMRRGEVLGLRWDHVDLDTARLVVAQALLSVEYETAVSDVKTANSRRTVDLDARTVAVLRAWRKRQLELLLLTGRTLDATALVFARADANPTPRLLLPDLRTTHRPDRPPQDPTPRPAPHPRLHTPPSRHTRESRLRTPRPRQPSLHHERLPTHPPRHASRRRRGVRRCRIRSGHAIGGSQEQGGTANQPRIPCMQSERRRCMMTVLNDQP